MRFDWMRTLVAISTAAMEASWMYILIYVLTVRPDPEMAQSVLSSLAVFGLLAGSLAYTALQDYLGLRGRVTRGLFIALILLASAWLGKGGVSGHYGLFDGPSWRAWLDIVTDLNNEQFLRATLGIVAGLLLCLRGTTLHELELETPVRSFRLGMVVASFAILVGAIFFLDIEAAGPTLIRAVLSFFFFGLLGVAVTQLRRERTSPRERPGLRWVLILLPAIGVILATGILVASIFSPDLAQMLTSSWDRFTEWVIWLITPIVVAAYAVLSLILVLLEPGTETGLTPTAEADATPIIQTITPMEDLIRPPEGVSDTARIIITSVVVALIAIGILYLIWRFLSRARTGDAVFEERESLWSWDALSLDLQNWLARLRQSLGRERAGGLRALLEQLRGPPTTVTIRRAYIHLLLLALERGLIRGDGQTPWEYLPDLLRDMPEHAEESDQLTEAYVQARYDPRPAPAELAQQAEAAWGRISERERLRDLSGSPAPSANQEVDH